MKLDFNDDAFVQKNIVDRMPLNSRIAGYGGTIGTVGENIIATIKMLNNFCYPLKMVSSKRLKW